MRSVAVALGASTILPITDQSVQALLEHRQMLGHEFVLPLPSMAQYLAASDKHQLLGLAERAGFAVPETVVLSTAADRAAIPGAEFFPAVVKPHRSVVELDGRRVKVNVAMVDGRASCERALDALPAGAFPVLLQRRVFGVAEGLFVLRWHGRIVAAFSHRRLREKPPAGGQSVYRESVALAPDLVEPGVRLLEALDWEGVAMIETKRDQVSGRPVVIEINGRLWGSLQLAVDAGVDFPTLLIRSALGIGVQPITAYQIGVRSRWLWGDVDHLYLRLTRSAAELHLAEDSGGRLGALMEFLTYRPGRDRCEVWRWGDPGPFLLETARRLGLGERA